MLLFGRCERCLACFVKLAVISPDAADFFPAFFTPAFGISTRRNNATAMDVRTPRRGYSRKRRDEPVSHDNIGDKTDKRKKRERSKFC